MNRLIPLKTYFLKSCTTVVTLLFSSTMLIGFNTFGQNLTYNTTVNSSSGQNYSVAITLELTAIVPVQSTCAWGYNYDVAYDYDVQIVGSNANLYTLAGYLTCGSNQGIYFDLPNNGGSGSTVTQGNPWTNNTDCGTSTIQTMLCNSIDLQIEGDGIPLQTITLTPSTNNNGVSGQDWCTNGNNADSTNFIGTVNPNPLNLRTNNEERMRITGDGNIGIGVANPIEKFEMAGNLKLTGDVIFSNYADVSDTTGKFLLVDQNGRTQAKTLDQMQQSMYASKFCPNDGSPILNPTWQNGENKIFSPCPQVNVGIGTNNPLRKLEVIGIAKATSIELGNPSASSALINGFRQTNQYDRLLRLGTNPPNGTEKIVMELFTNGELTLYHDGLGSPFTVFDENQFKLLQLEGTGLLRARKIRIDLDTWADYVFEPQYKLMPLNELKTYVTIEKHLPGVPSAEEVEEEGIDLGEMNQVLLEKIEELTLYVIELNEEVGKLKAAAKN